MKKVLLHCGELSPKNWLKKHEKVTILTPSREGAIKQRITYIRTYGGMIDRTYLTFDNWLKSFVTEKTADSVFQSFVLEKVLKEGPSPFYDTMVDPLLSFFHDLDSNCVQGKELQDCEDDYFKSLADVYEKFQTALAKMGYNSGLQLQKVRHLKIPKGQYVLEGFLTFSPLQMEILKRFSEDSNVIINIPHNFKNCRLITDMVEQFICIGFEVERGRECDVTDCLKGKEIISYDVPQYLTEIFYGKYKEMLQEKSTEDITVYYGNLEVKEAILRQGVYERVEWNCDSKNNSQIFREWLQLLLYFQEKNKDHLLCRLQMHYFPILEDEGHLAIYLQNQNFQGAEEFYDYHMSLPLQEKDYQIFVKFFQRVQQEELASEDEMEHYLEYFTSYLEEAEKIVAEDYELLQDEQLYRQDREALDFLRLTFDTMRQYYDFSPVISREDLLGLMILYLKRRTLSDIKNRRGSLLLSLLEGYDIQSNVKIFLQFNGEYSSDSQNSFLYGKGHERALKKLGLWKDSLELDFLQLLVALQGCEKAIFFTDSKESGFSPMYYMLKKYGSIEETFLYQRHITSSYNQFSQIIRGPWKENISPQNLEQILQRLQNHIFSSTDFDTYIMCPRFYFYQRIFHLEEVERGFKEEIQKEEGIAYHKVLEHFYRPGRPMDEKISLKHLILRFFFENRKQEELDFYEEISFQNFYHILNSYLEKEEEFFQESGFIPYLTEEKFNFSLGTIAIQGMIDRIDSKDGKEIITDYKRRGGAAIQDVREGYSLQLPIYALSRESVGREVVAMRYGELLNGKIKNVLVNQEELPYYGTKNSKVSREEFQHFLADSKERVISCHKKIMEGEFPRTPLREEQCQKCIYRGVCRR